VTAEDYLRMVAFELRDLPWSQRRELISELRGHLDELPAGTDLDARLGTPEDYAADLRSAAGLERRRGAIAFLRARRPRNVILAAALLVVVGLTIGAVAWIDSYEPIAFANGSIDPVGAKGAPGLDGNVVVFHKGRPFELGITIRNTGKFTVRVLGVPYFSALPFSARLRMSLPQKREEFLPPYVPFRPFDLKPGDMRLLLLKGVYACHSGMPAGSSFGIASLPVRFSFLWRTATTDVPLPQELAIVLPKGCPPATGGSATP
jgi:hypothetical protein